MRAIFLVILVLLLAAIVAIGTGFVQLDQTRAARAPTIKAEDGRIATTPGTAPAFDVQTGSIKLETEQRAVPVPTVRVVPPAEGAAKDAPAG